MLNGQLPLAALYFHQMSLTRLSRPGLWVAGALGIALISGCASTTTRAPVVDLSKQLPGSSPASSGGSYVVKPGDTLYKIARSNGVSIASLRQWNSITDANQLSVGQVLKLGPGAAAGGMAGTSSSSPVATPTPVTDPGVSTGTAGDSAPTTPATGTAPGASTTAPPASASTPAPSVSTPRAADANTISWGWPASGPVTQTFTTATKGIDIGGALGAPVVAAADGKVMYSGNGVRGLGNLIIVNHENGFITAYAHNRTLSVKTGETVKRGSKIAEIGQSDTTSPRLHFEIRRQGTPVDPMQYLPAR